MSTSRMPATPCRVCGYVISAATGVTTSDLPSPGDVSLCFGCGLVSVFDDQLVPVEPPADVLAELEADERVVAIRAEIVGLQR